MLVHLQLEMHGQLAVSHGLRQIALERQLVLRLSQHRVFEQHYPVAAGGLGAVHRGIGGAQQVVRASAGA